jgi:hypothetical protein
VHKCHDVAMVGSESSSATPGEGDDERQRVLGFHSIADGPSLRISNSSLLALPGRVASAHEQTHSLLTQWTAFGQLMQCCSLLGEVSGPVRHDVHLRRLASQCRTTHESLATFDSIWTQADGDISLLYGSCEYLNWYKDAHDVIPLPDHGRLKLIALHVLAEVCMSPPVLERFLDLGPSSADVWCVPPQDRPDRRLGLFHETAEETFWSAAWADCRALMDADSWDVLAPDAPSPDKFTESFRQDYDDLLESLWAHLRERFADLLHQCGAQTVKRTDDIIERTIDLVEAAAPGSRRRIGIAGTSSEDVLRSLFSERLLLSDERRPARLLALKWNWHLPLHWISDEDPRPFMFIIVRSANRLLDQFAFTPNMQSYLAQCGNTLFTLVVVEPDDGEWQLLHVREPSELVTLAERFKGEADIHVNWSMVSMGLATRADRSVKCVDVQIALQAKILADFRTAILDFPITAAIRGWVNEGMKFRYSYTIIRVSGQERINVVAICPLGPDYDFIIIVPCGEPQRRALFSFFDRTCPGAREDNSLLGPESEKRSVFKILEVFLHSEHVVDFPAVRRE